MIAEGRHLGRRVRILGLTVVVAVVVAMARPAPPPRTLDGLALMLARVVHAAVSSSDVVWEPGRGVLTEAFLGRRVLFLAATGPKGERDLFRARVRLSAEGQPVDIAGLRNVTETPLGDDAALQVRDDTAVFATTAFGRVQGVTALDLAGTPLVDRPGSVIGRLMLTLASFRRTGSLGGIGRTDVVFDTPARSARILLEPPRLLVDVEEPTESVVIDLREPAPPSEPGHLQGLRVVRQDYRGRSTLPWAVDLLRSVVGPSPVGWLEKWAFGARDVTKRGSDKLFGWSSPSRPKRGEPSPVARVLRPAELSGGDTGWPPAPIPSLWERPKAGEGQWTKVDHALLAKLPGDPGKSAPPYFYTSFLRPDPDRPYAEVLLVAMDMRQLELGMEGGYEEPQPAVGPPGTGRIPRRVLSRTVAAFNGAFRAEHGAYGMMVDGRILLPPVPNAASIVVTREGGTGFGSWPGSSEIPAGILSFRQNLDPLVDAGVVNPAKRFVWGWQVAGESSLTERTALCLTPAGHVYYAWGRDVRGSGLARALKQAGCDYAVHLDMNPRHCGFVFMHADSSDAAGGSFRLADPGMNINPTRYAVGSDKDFFYVMLRDLAPADPSLSWEPSPGVQPPPAWLPGVFEAKRLVGDLEVSLVGFDAGRVDWAVRPGSEEPQGADGSSEPFEPGGAERTVATVGLGHTTDALRYGLAYGGRAPLPLRQSYATVVLAPGRSPRIVAPGERAEVGAAEQAVQLPLLADDGKVDARAADRGGSRLRGAFCVTPGDRVLIALARHDSSDPLASVLLESGCRRVVGLDRGSRHAAFVQRAATDDAPVGRFTASVLVALGRPMTPHAFRWR